MFERLLIVLFMTALGLAAYWGWQQLHRRRLGRLPAEGRPTLLYFRSDHCPPCVTQSHYLDQLQQIWNGRLAIRKIDADTEPEKAGQYGVFTLPTTIVVDGRGQVHQINYGLTNSHKLMQQLRSL